jgi:hypothetical protein
MIDHHLIQPPSGCVIGITDHGHNLTPLGLDAMPLLVMRKPSGQLRLRAPALKNEGLSNLMAKL